MESALRFLDWLGGWWLWVFEEEGLDFGEEGVVFFGRATRRLQVHVHGCYLKGVIGWIVFGVSRCVDKCVVKSP